MPDAQALPFNFKDGKVNMHNQIPENIIDGVAAMLAPYCPGLTTERLQMAVSYKPEEKEIEKLLTRKEVAEILTVSLPTVDRCLRDGVLPKRRIRGAVRIPASAVASLASK